MKARDLIGRRIVKVVQERVYPKGYLPYTSMQRIVLDNGTVLYFTAIETDGDPDVEAHVFKPEKKPKS